MSNVASASEHTPILTVDVLVIGWGKGGKTFAGVMADAGSRVAIVEQSPDMYGGTCINIGCVPTKALLHSATTRRQDDDARQYFMRAVADRDTLIGTLNAANHRMLADSDAVTIIDGRARFIGERTIEVTPTAGGDSAQRMRVAAETVVVNTGAVPIMPNIPGVHSDRVHDSTSIQHVDPLPQHLVIVGAGPIALEFGAMFRGFGSEVTVIARGTRLLPKEDDDVAEAVTEILTNDGVRILTETRVASFEERDTGIDVHCTDGNPLSVDAVLCATGRRPATDDLGLEAAGIAVDERGAIVVDDRLRTSVPGVFAMGDVWGGSQQTYLSLDDHRVVLDQVRGDGTRRVSDRRAVPATIFLSPPFSSVGVTEREARDQGVPTTSVMVPVAKIAAMPKPKIVGETRGFIKVVVHAESREILGARLMHVDSQEVINLIALAMRHGVTADALRDGIWTHPSATEALNEVLGKL